MDVGLGNLQRKPPKSQRGENICREGAAHRWYGLQAVGKGTIYGAEAICKGVNALYPDGLKAIPPFW
jgi:hypothetical protein